MDVVKGLGAPFTRRPVLILSFEPGQRAFFRPNRVVGSLPTSRPLPPYPHSGLLAPVYYLPTAAGLLEPVVNTQRLRSLPGMSEPAHTSSGCAGARD